MSPAEDLGRDRGLPRLASAGIVAAALGFTAMLAMRNSPNSFHPGIRRWYQRLEKPDYTPPDAVFGGVWPVIEFGLAIGGYRLLRQGPTPPRNLAVRLWLLNVGMIGGWTELFFRRRKLGPSTAASGAMIASGAAYVATAARVDRIAAIAGLPYVAWLGFATLLAERIWKWNRTSAPLA